MRTAYSHMQRSNQCIPCVPFTSGVFRRALCIFGYAEKLNWFRFFCVLLITRCISVSCVALWAIYNAKCAHTAQKTQAHTHTARCDSALTTESCNNRVSDQGGGVIQSSQCLINVLPLHNGRGHFLLDIYLLRNMVEGHYLRSNEALSNINNLD